MEVKPFAAFAGFSNTALEDADFTGAALTYANLNGANLTGANFSKTNLRHTILTEAHNGPVPETEPSHGKRISLGQADLSYADLSRVTFAGVSFAGALFKQTNLSGARLLWVRELTDEQLRGACGTGTVTIQFAYPPRVESIPLRACTGEKDVRPDPPPLGACSRVVGERADFIAR
jgi:hypothetical protein